MVRVTVEDSVDEHIYDLQVKKLRELQNAFQEFEAGQNLDKETLYQLLGWKPADEECLGGDDSETDEYEASRDDFDDSYVN